MPTALDIQNWIQEGNARGARAMLVVWDTFPRPWEPYPVYVAPGENIAQRFAAFDGVNMQRVTAVHVLGQN